MHLPESLYGLPLCFVKVSPICSVIKASFIQIPSDLFMLSNPTDPLQTPCLQVGYPCLSLHGAKDQSDRESTINDFKTGVSNVLVATSIAARGLDVKDLVLVVNYEVPNHHEDYVHRVGRTGQILVQSSCAHTTVEAVCT